MEKSTIKSRCAILIKNDIEYIRRDDLEETDLCACTIDINGSQKYRIINFYRLFNPPNNHSQTEHFALQLNLIDKISANTNGRKLIIAGDFNLDNDNRYSTSYRFRNLFEIQNTIFDRHHLIQIIEFPTWHRVVNNVLKQSVIDHVYVKDPTDISNIYAIEPLVGDHKLIIFDILHTQEPLKPSMKRNWQKYKTELLWDELASINFNIVSDDVQSMWNKF